MCSSSVTHSVWTPASYGPKSILPCLPSRFVVIPEAIEDDFVPQGVHSVPKSVVLVGGEFAISGEAFQWCAFKDCGIIIDVVQNRRLGDEVSAIDPAAVVGWLFSEARPAVLDAEPAVAGGRLNGGDSGDRPGVLMECDYLPDVQVGHAITVCEAEGVVADVVLCAQ